MHFFGKIVSDNGGYRAMHIFSIMAVLALGLVCSVVLVVATVLRYVETAILAAILATFGYWLIAYNIYCLLDDD